MPQSFGHPLTSYFRSISRGDLSAEFIIYSSFSGYGNRLCAENDADTERNAKSVPAPDNYQFTEETKIVKKGMQ